MGIIGRHLTNLSRTKPINRCTVSVFPGGVWRVEVMQMTWEIQGNRSFLYPVLQKRLKDEFQKLINEQITPWIFMTTSAGLKIKKFDGKQISYDGIEFSGLPEAVFWGGYIEPFLEDISFRAIDAAIAKSKAQDTILQPVLRDVLELLKLGFDNVYARMADVDRRLRGKGYPESAPQKDTTPYLKKMERFVVRRIEAELKLWKPVPWFAGLERFYENNKGLVWIIGSLIAAVGVMVGIAKEFLG